MMQSMPSTTRLTALRLPPARIALLLIVLAFSLNGLWRKTSARPDGEPVARVLAASFAPALPAIGSIAAAHAELPHAASASLALLLLAAASLAAGAIVRAQPRVFAA